MAIQTVDTTDMQHMFAVIRDGGFGWTVAEVPDLMATLGWTIDTEIEGKGAVADTPWGVPDAEVALLYRQQRVESLTIRVTSRGIDEPADRAGRRGGVRCCGRNGVRRARRPG